MAICVQAPSIDRYVTDIQGLSDAALAKTHITVHPTNVSLPRLVSPLSTPTATSPSRTRSLSHPRHTSPGGRWETTPCHPCVPSPSSRPVSPKTSNHVFLNPFRAALQICSFPGWSLVVLYYGVGSICQVCNEIGDGNQTRFRESPSLIIIIFFFICLRVTFAFVYATFLRMRK